MSEPISLFVGRNKLWASADSLASFSLGDLFYGDVMSLRVYLLSPNPATGNGYPAPWTVSNIGDLSLKFAVGDVDTADAMTPLVSNNSWAKDSDNKFFYADVSFATAPLKTALGSLAQLQKYLEIKQSKGGLDTTVFQQAVTIKPRAIGLTNVVPSTPDTPISKEEAIGTFLPRIAGLGDILRLPSANGLYATDIFTDNDGNFRTEQVIL